MGQSSVGEPVALASALVSPAGSVGPLLCGRRLRRPPPRPDNGHLQQRHVETQLSTNTLTSVPMARPPVLRLSA